MVSSLVMLFSCWSYLERAYRCRKSNGTYTLAWKLEKGLTYKKEIVYIFLSFYMNICVDAFANDEVWFAGIILLDSSEYWLIWLVATLCWNPTNSVARWVGPCPSNDTQFINETWHFRDLEKLCVENDRLYFLCTTNPK